MSQMRNQNPSTANRERVAKAIRLANMNSQQRREYVLREKIRAGTDHYDTLVNGPNSGYPQNVGRFDNAGAPFSFNRDRDLWEKARTELVAVYVHIRIFKGKTIPGDSTIYRIGEEHLNQAYDCISRIQDPRFKEDCLFDYKKAKRALEVLR